MGVWVRARAGNQNLNGFGSIGIGGRNFRFVVGIA